MAPLAVGPEVAEALGPVDTRAAGHGPGQLLATPTLVAGVDGVEDRLADQVVDGVPHDGEDPGAGVDDAPVGVGHDDDVGKVLDHRPVPGLGPAEGLDRLARLARVPGVEDDTLAGGATVVHQPADGTGSRGGGDGEAVVHSRSPGRGTRSPRARCGHPATDGAAMVRRRRG